MVLRRNNGMRAGAVGHAQAGAEVVRICHAVEHQHQRRPLYGFKNFVEGVPQCQRGHPRHHALVPRRACKARQSTVAAVDDPGTGLTHALGELAHARVTALGVEVDLEHRLRRGLEAHGDGMKTEKDAVAHGQPGSEACSMA